jgi:hypothetical protein
MLRKINVDRTFFLGNFKNIKIGDSLDDIPEELAMNQEFIGRLYFLLLVSVEWAYREYQRLNLELGGEKSLEESLAILENLKDTTTQTIKELIKNGKTNV